MEADPEVSGPGVGIVSPGSESGCGVPLQVRLLEPSLVWLGSPSSTRGPVLAIFSGCQGSEFGTCPGRLGPGVSSRSRFVWT